MLFTEKKYWTERRGLINIQANLLTLVDPSDLNWTAYPPQGKELYKRGCVSPLKEEGVYLKVKTVQL